MKRIIFFVPIIFSMAILLSTAAHDNVKPCYTTDIAITEQGNILLSNKGTSELRMINPEGTTLKSWSLPEPATGVVTIHNRAYVTSSYATGSLSCFEIDGEQKTLFSTPTGMGACSPVVSADSKVIYVCNRYKATISEVDATTGEVLREVDVLREPCAATLSADGKKLYVNNFLPMQRADVDYVSAAVSVIDCNTFKKINDITLCNGSNALRGIATSPDGKYIFVSHNLGRYQVPTSQLQQGWMNTNAVSVIDAQNDKFIGSMSLDEPDRGAGGVWDIACNDKHLIVSQSGTHDISIIDYPAMIARFEAYEDYSKLDYDLYFMRDIRTRLPLAGNGPRSLSIKDGVAYIPTYFSDTLNIVNIAEQKSDFIAYNPSRIEAPADRGEKAFNDAALCYQNWQSCNGCHPGDGRADAMNWDLMNDGIGNPKNCKSMLYSFDTPKCMISGIRDHAGLAVRAGYKFIQFCDIPEDKAVDVDEYIRSLKPLPSPYLVDGKLSEKAEYGRKVFEKYSCAECHSG